MGYLCLWWLTLLVVSPCRALVASGPQSCRIAVLHSRAVVMANLDGTMLAELSKDLAAVKALQPRLRTTQTSFPEEPVARSLWQAAGLDPSLRYKVSGMVTGEPSFTRLFSHETWRTYSGVSPAERWMRSARTWRHSTIWSAIWPLCLFAAVWAYAIASLPVLLLPRTSPLPLMLMGSAIGLLLVFRTNNTYLRLAEARVLWAQAVFFCREIAQTTATALAFDSDVRDRRSAATAAARTCRLLAAWCWELAKQLTGPPDIRDSNTAGVYSDEILQVLLPANEVEWLEDQRSRPAQILGLLRQIFHSQYRAGNLPVHVHRKLDEDVKGLDMVLTGCYRLFASPLPPTMSRHVVRCLQLWLLGLPLVLAGSMAPPTTAFWVFITSYIFVGIEEVGVQVEQPFEILPMTELCNVIMFNLEEAFDTPALPFSVPA